MADLYLHRWQTALFITALQHSSSVAWQREPGLEIRIGLPSSTRGSWHLSPYPCGSQAASRNASPRAQRMNEKHRPYICTSVTMVYLRLTRQITEKSSPSSRVPLSASRSSRPSRRCNCHVIGSEYKFTDAPSASCSRKMTRAVSRIFGSIPQSP